MKKMFLTLMFLSTFLLISCEKETEISNTTSQNQYLITSGQSFGMCVGPCQQELIIQGNQVKFRVLTRPNRGSGGNAIETIYDETLTQTELNNILNEIDFTKFNQLKEVYGCPDCADGGTEYIEIQSGEMKHQVRFEYGKTVAGIEKLITLLREKRLKFSEKYVK